MEKISQICIDHIFGLLEFMISDLGGVSNMGHYRWEGEILESGGRQKIILFSKTTGVLV